jgi:hypothetical protein
MAISFSFSFITSIEEPQRLTIRLYSRLCTNKTEVILTTTYILERGRLDLSVLSFHFAEVG